MTASLHYDGMKVFVAEGTRCLKDLELAERLNVAGDAQREGKFDLADTILRQVIADCPHAELPVDVLCPLTVRTLKTLYDHKAVTVADLVRCKLADLRGWYNFGKLSRMFLGKRMQAFGLNLAEQSDYAWVKARRKSSKPHLDRCLLLPTFSLPDEEPAESAFKDYEGPLCGTPVLGSYRDFYPDTEPPCALPLDHPGWHLSQREIADERTWLQWVRQYAPLALAREDP